MFKEPNLDFVKSLGCLQGRVELKTKLSNGFGLGLGLR